MQRVNERHREVMRKKQRYRERIRESENQRIRESENLEVLSFFDLTNNRNNKYNAK